MPRMARKHDTDPWFDDPTRQKEEDPHRQYVRIVATRTKWWRLIQIITLIFSIIAVAAATNTPTPTAPIQTVDLDADGKQAAWALTQTWLNSKPLGADTRIISWDGADTIRLANQGKPVTATAHRLTVSDGRHWWQVMETVKTDGTPIGYPAVSPIRVPAQNTPDANDDWTGVLKTVDQSDALTQAVSQWGKALAGSDADRLKVSVDDPDPASVYQPLMLAGQVQAVSIQKIMYADRGKVDRENDTSNRAYARIGITLSGGGQGNMNYGYDVLIADPDGTPHVIAWGAPGMAPSFHEYGNRWHGQPLDADMQDGQATDATDSQSTPNVN